MRDATGRGGDRIRELYVQPIVAHSDPGGYIAESYRRKRQRIAQFKLRMTIVLVCLWMSFLMV